MESIWYLLAIALSFLEPWGIAAFIVWSLFSHRRMNQRVRLLEKERQARSLLPLQIPALPEPEKKDEPSPPSRRNTVRTGTRPKR